VGRKSQRYPLFHVPSQFRGGLLKNLASTSAAFVYSREDLAAVKIRVCKSRDDLLAVLRERQAELNVSCGTIEAIAGIADGYTSKVLSLTPTKNLGPIALGAILGALGLGIVRIVIEEDPQAAAAVSGRWVPRRRRPNPKKPPVWCVVADSSEAQPSFTFVNPEREQGPDVDHSDNDPR
jgi:hypothetical protein